MTDDLLEFDEERLRQDLETLNPEVRAIFAAACAERLVPAYERFSERNKLGDPRALRSALSTLWRALKTGDEAGLEDAQDATESLLESLPLEGVEEVVELATMEDATAGALYAIECALTGNPQSAVWSARRVYEALDHSVSMALDLDFNVPGSEERVLVNTSIQAELIRQRRDLQKLQSAPRGELGTIVGEISRQAQEDGKELLGHLQGGAGGA